MAQCITKALSDPTPHKTKIVSCHFYIIIAGRNNIDIGICRGENYYDRFTLSFLLKTTTTI